MSGEYCQAGEDCAAAGMAAAGEGSGLYVWVLLTTGVTAAAFMLDIYHRYMKQRSVDLGDTRSMSLSSNDMTTEVRATLSRLTELETERRQQISEEHSQQAQLLEAVRKVERAAQRSLAQVPQVVAAPQTLSSAPPSSLSANQQADQGWTGTVRGLINDLFDTLRAAADFTPQQEQESSASCREQMEAIVQLQESCNTLSCEFDKVSVQLVKRAVEEEEEATEETGEGAGSNGIHAYQKRRFAMRNQWSSIRRIFYCIDVHLKNAATYHQYFYEVEQLQRLVARYNAGMNAKLETEVEEVDTLEELQEFVEFADSSSKNLVLWEDNIARLTEESKSVVPVHMRTDPLEEPVAARLLCAYRDANVSVNEGESVTLHDNQDENQWKVELTSGEKAALPAVVCLIPPPDTEAAKALSSLTHCLSEAYIVSKIQYQRRMILILKNMIEEILKNYRQCLAVVHADTKASLLADLALIRKRYHAQYSEDENWPAAEDALDELQKVITDAPEDGEEAECLQQVIEILKLLISTINGYESLLKSLDIHKSLHLHAGHVEAALSAGSDWDTLEDLEQAKREMTLGVSVRRESAQIGETSTFESASGETRSTFSIKSVVDPRDNSEMSMSDAISRGIIDPNRGVYINPVTKEETAIPLAMEAGLILVESTKTSRSRELKKAVGIVTVKYTRETRPYSVTAIMDPRTDQKLSVAKAIEEGVFDQSREMWCNPDSGEEMTVENAIDCGGFIVEYDPEAEVTDPETNEKTFAVFGVLDRRTNKRLPFHEAVEKGLIDKDEGIYIDALTSERMNVVEAFKNNYVRGRVIEDPKQLDYYLSKTMSGSHESLNSEGSFGN